MRRLSRRLDHDVDRVERIHARVVQPGGEDLKAPQFAPVLVRHDVVRVVAARAEQLKRTDQRHAVGRDPEGDGAVAAVAPAGDIGQQTIDVLGEKLAHLRVGRDVGRVRLDHELIAIEQRQVRFRDVVAERVKEARRDHLGAGRQFGRVSRVEAQQVDPVVRVPEHERRPQPLVLQQQDAPGARHRGRLIVPAAAAQLLHAHARAAVTIHVPRTVEHVTQRVDALGRDDLLAGMPFPGRPKVADTASRSTLRLRGPGSGAGRGVGSRSSGSSG